MALATSTGRYVGLASPKVAPATFTPDRRTLYWIEKQPLKPGPDGTTAFACTERVSALSSHKHYGTYRIGDRPTPVWAVQKGALSAEATPRVEELSLPKSKAYTDYQYDKPVITPISQGAKSGQVNEKSVERLTLWYPHKKWGESRDQISEGPIDQSITFVSAGAQKAKCSGRVESLSAFKEYHSDYHGERPVMWDVTQNAKKAQASMRLQQLARPKSARLRKDDYDPFKVTFGAKNAIATTRLTELCAPLSRKQRQKIITST